MEPIEAIYEHGVFRPLEPVALPENCTRPSDSANRPAVN